MTLCGISSRFQLLSPTERQVSHALLTRSPLSNNRNHYSVRLACVRHAASVRPEPGSNSQKIVSKALKEPQIKFLNNLLLAILLKNFRWLNFDFKSILNNLKLSKVFLVRLSRYSIYKAQCRSVAFISCPPRTFICQHILIRLSRTFFKFFEKLFKLRLSSRQRRSSDNFYILADVPEFVKHFFQVSQNFFRFRPFATPFFRRLAYTTTYCIVCQGFSLNFFRVKQLLRLFHFWPSSAKHLSFSHGQIYCC